MPGSVSRSEMFSSINPIETFVGRSASMSRAVMIPGLACGNSLVSDRMSSDIITT